MLPIVDFFNEAFKSLFGTHGAAWGAPRFVLRSFETSEAKNYCFIEVNRHVSLTHCPHMSHPILPMYQPILFLASTTSEELRDVALQMDGIDYYGFSLKTRLPNVTAVATSNYHPQLTSPRARALPPLRWETLNVTSTHVPESKNKLFIGGLPRSYTSREVRQLLSGFGRLKGFNLITEVNARNNKGFAFFEYEDPSVSDVCIKALHGVQLVGSTGCVTVERTRTHAQETSRYVSRTRANKTLAAHVNQAAAMLASGSPHVSSPLGAASSRAPFRGLGPSEAPRRGALPPGLPIPASDQIMQQGLPHAAPSRDNPKK